MDVAELVRQSDRLARRFGIGTAVAKMRRREFYANVYLRSGGWRGEPCGRHAQWSPHCWAFSEGCGNPVPPTRMPAQ